MNEFLVSTGRVVVRDPDTQVGLYYGTMQITTAFTTAMMATEVRGGVGNSLLLVYMHDKKISIKLDQATYANAIMGFNAGQLPVTGTYTVLQTESVTLSNNVGNTSLTPLSDIFVSLSDGTIQNITPSGKTFTVVAGGSQTVTAIYNVSTTADQIRFDAATPPKTLDVSIIGEIRNDSGKLTNYLVISIPRLQVDGNFTYSMAANGVSQLSFGGFAVVATDTDGTAYYAKQWKVPVTTTATTTSAIVALPSGMIFTAGVAGAQNAKAIAIQGSASNDVTTSSSFVASGSSFVAGLHTGLVSISASAAISGISGSVTVSYASGSSTFTDLITLSIP